MNCTETMNKTNLDQVKIVTLVILARLLTVDFLLFLHAIGHFAARHFYSAPSNFSCSTEIASANSNFA